MKIRLGDLLLENELITREDLQEALERQKNANQKRLGEILTETGKVSETDILETLALQMEITLLDLEDTEIDEEAVKIFPEALALKYGCVPIRWKDGALVLAMADPLNLQAVDDLSRIAKCEIELALAQRGQIESVIRKVNQADSMLAISDSLPELDGFMRVETLVEDNKEKEENIADLRNQSQQAPVIRIVNTIINEAIHENASDIHIDPQADSLVVRNRIDGVLYEKHRLPRWIHRPVVSRIKIVADMDIAERRLPQDGKIRITVGSGQFDLRISSLPSAFGEKVVIRLLKRTVVHAGLDELGLSPAQVERIRTYNAGKQGLVLVTGPTGSGKSTTLNAMLHELRTPRVNIVTVEDPVEYDIPDTTQVQVNSKIGLTFPAALRSILRQDPDIVMIGEIRDSDTADIAIRAAMTGHLVLTTLHTNDALSAVTRLENIGIPPYLVSSTLLYVLAQRLVRKLCPKCSTEYQPTSDEIREIEKMLPQAGALPWRKGEGCDRCGQRGFSGRVAVGELFAVNDEIKGAIELGQRELVLRKLAARNGMDSLLGDFIEKVLAGVTAVSEVWSVFVNRATSSGACPECGAAVDQAYLTCPSCGFMLKDTCPICDRPLEDNWRFCPYCHNPNQLKNKGLVEERRQGERRGDNEAAGKGEGVEQRVADRRMEWPTHRGERSPLLP